MTSSSPTSLPAALLVLRSAIGGLLMGLANLVPGISGGTMLLAAGIYPRLVEAVANLSTLKLKRESILVLGAVVVAAAVAVLLFAGIVKDLVVTRRWIMYSLFIGLTLGGAPVVWRLARPVNRAVWLGAACGFVVMVLLALAQRQQAGAGSAESNFVLLVVAGLAGASAMILPGVSGGYLLLVLGQYLPILAGIDAFKTALSDRDWSAATVPAINVLFPVGVGVLAGVIGVSNLLRWLLGRYEKATLGVLLGLLLGAVVGLWPFQEMVEPIIGETIIKGQVVTVENLVEFDPEDYPTQYFSPAASHVGGALAFIALGLGVTTLIARFGRED